MHKEFDPIFYPYYGMLNNNEKALYRSILSEIRAAKAEIAPGQGISVKSEEAFNVINAIYYDRPELFWLESGSSTSTINGIVVTVKPKYNKLKNNIISAQTKLNRVVMSYLRSVQGKKPLDQERIIHDKMVNEISYVKNEFDQTAYAALVNGKAVCAGYTRAFQLLMQQLDIPCYYCMGECLGTGKKEWGSHAWNILKFGNDYYNMDITWDDCYDSHPKDRIGYTYYNCTDSDMASNHKRRDEAKRLPACRGTKYGFEKVTGISPELSRVLQDGVTYETPVTTKAEYFSLVEQHLRKNRTNFVVFSFPAKGSLIKENSTKWLGEIISKLYPRSGYSINTKSTDYMNGWYRLELIVNLK